jgi:hypothetical protein
MDDRSKDNIPVEVVFFQVPDKKKKYMATKRSTIQKNLIYKHLGKFTAFGLTLNEGSSAVDGVESPLHTMICRRVIAHGVLIGMIFSHLHRLQCIHDRQCGSSSDCNGVQEHYNGVREVKRSFVVYR